MARRVNAVGPFAAMAIFGTIAVGCSKEQAQPAPVPPAPAVVTAAAVKPPPEEHVTMPGGWRDLRFGMSEADVKKIVLTYRSNSDSKWEKSQTANLPTVRYEIRKIDHVRADQKRFHEWSIRNLDEGAESVHTWFDGGKLVAIQLKGRTTSDVFTKKAADAYGAAPRHASFEFFDDRSMMHEFRNVSYWHGDDMTAFIWVSSSSPTLLLWSNPAMGDHATQYQAVLDAPVAAANKAEQAKENGTKF